MKKEKSENAEEDAFTIVVPPLTALLFFCIVGTLDDASFEEDGSVCARMRVYFACVFMERERERERRERACVVGVDVFFVVFFVRLFPQNPLERRVKSQREKQRERE